MVTKLKIRSKNMIRLLVLAALILGIFSSCSADGIQSDQVPPSSQGAVYEISDNGEYVIITGYSEEFPKISIPTEIEGLPVTEIAQNAFTNNYDIYTVILPETVTVIGEGAFRNCRSLTAVTLPSSLTALPDDCFRDCRVLKTVVLPETLTSIGDFCFQGCTKLGKLRIPQAVTNIGYDAFMFCENLYLDVTENEYAAQYAAENKIVTDFRGTSNYFWMMMGIGTAIALVILLIASMIFYRHLRKHPEHNPNNFIFKVLGKIYNGLSFLYRKIKFGIIWVLSHILWGITQASKWLKLKFGKKKRSSPKNNTESDDRLD